MGFYRLRGRVLIILVIFLGLALGPVWAYECQKCPKRDLAVFAIGAPPLKQDAMLSYGDWYPMHLVTDGVYDVLFNEDPSKGCLTFIEAQMAAQGVSAGSRYQSGMGHFAAPAGAIGGADYIITGSIAIPQMGSQYIISISLQAAESREEVASVSGAYDFSKGGGDNGRALARGLMPLMEKIRDFEKRKRSEVPAVAIDVDNGLTIQPARRVIKTHETVKIKYRLQDCDGEPLKGRILAPFATLGHLDVHQPPQTDGNGELELEFTARGKTGMARLRGEFQYVQPFGREDTGGGEAGIRIVDHSLWASVDISQEKHRRLDEPGGHTIKKESSNGSTAFSVYMFFEPKPFRVYYADTRLVPVRFKHRLAGFMPNQFVHNASGNSYEGVRGYPGMSREITASYTEMVQLDGIELVQQDDDYVTYEVDPDSGSITRMDLPRLEARYTVFLNRTCEKVDHDKHSRQDCSDKWSEHKTFSTQMPAESECEEIAGIGPHSVGGGCRKTYSGQYEKRTVNFAWEFHRE